MRNLLDTNMVYSSPQGFEKENSGFFLSVLGKRNLGARNLLDMNMVHRSPQGFEKDNFRFFVAMLGATTLCSSCGHRITCLTNIYIYIYEQKNTFLSHEKKALGVLRLQLIL